VVTLSESSKQEMVDDLGFSPDRVTVVNPGTDPYWTPGGAKSSTPTVLGVGRLVPVKDFVRLVRVASAAREEVPDLRVVIVGEGYERSRIVEAIHEHHAEDWVTLHGRLTDSELRNLYRSSWLVASTSVREGWGMTITEAAACGTPCLATDIAGHRDAAVAGSSGLLASTDADLTDAMVRILRERDLRSRLERGALARAAELTWDATALGTFRVLATDALRRRR
jgi:glycosyltransferase involved in cell wall biosynthesis